MWALATTATDSSTFVEVTNGIVRVVEGIGIGVLVLGFVVVAITWLARPGRWTTRAYERVRRGLGRVIQLGLEVLVAADLIRTVIVDPTLASVAALGLLVLIRTLLSWSITVELEGTWPWRLRAAARDEQAVARPTT
jgi:uncharacterized membrane protein